MVNSCFCSNNNLYIKKLHIDNKIPASKKAFFCQANLQQGDSSYVLPGLVPNVRVSAFHGEEVKKRTDPSCRHPSSIAM